jgi:hypothetical protein
MSDRITHDDARNALAALYVARSAKHDLNLYINAMEARDAALLAAGLIDPATGEVRKVLSSSTNRDGPIVYSTLMVTGQTVVVFAAAESAGESK